MKMPKREKSCDRRMLIIDIINKKKTGKEQEINENR